MNLSELQADLRHFAAERDWQPFHTPKNLSTALMVEAAELAEIFQWLTPEQSRDAHHNPATQQRIGEEVVDVLLYLLQVADHSQIDIGQAVQDKVARNARKYPAVRSVARPAPARAVTPGTHVLLDFENVQPSEQALRALVPDVSEVWVFHGPHQKRVEQRFASFGVHATAVPISKTGKNALDFHLSFYMGYIASRNASAKMVVVANDKGYAPMLEHARSMGFEVRQMGYGEAQPASAVKSMGVAQAGLPAKTVANAVNAKVTPAKKVPATKAPVTKAPANAAPVKQPAAKPAPAKKVAAKKAVATKASVASPAAKLAPAKKLGPVKKAKAASPPAAKKAIGAAPSVAVKGAASIGKGARAVGISPDSAATIKKITDSLRKMGDKRPTKPASLRRSLKSFLGVGSTDKAVEAALAGLVERGVVTVDPVKGALYPVFDGQTGSVVTQVG